MANNLTKRLWTYFLQLNIYKKPSDNQESTRKDLIATRIYLCTLGLTVLIIAFATTFYSQTITSIEYSPSSARFTQLIHNYPSTLHCPCSKFSITYGTFVSIQIKLHQVCSSKFIEQAWIEKLFAEYNTFSLPLNDYRITLTFFWQIISDMCSISNRAWSNIVTNFNGSYIFSAIAIVEQSVENQIREVLNYEKSLSQTALTRNLYLLQRFAVANELVSSIATNFQLRYPDENSDTPKMFPREYNNCSCLNINGCPHTATFNDINGQIVTIPGMIADCLIIDGTLASTLECYYSQSCISLLHPSLVNQTQSLSNEENKYFNINSTVQMLFDEIMTDEFIDDIRYDEYYSQCNPSYCSYSYIRQHFDIIFVVTTIIGLVSTLSMIIRLIAPIFATTYLRWKSRTSSNNIVVQVQMATIEQNQHSSSFKTNLFTRFQQMIAEINLFEGETARTITIIYRERFLTRCFILLMMTATMIIAFYIFFQKQNQTITITNPSLDTYYQLYNDHQDSLKCPCSQLSMSYDKFINVSIILHEICSSDLLSPTWIDYVTSFDRSQIPSWTETPFSRDFRLIGASYFQLLNVFCSLAKTNIKNVHGILVNKKLISDYVRSPIRLLQETQAIINSFIDTTNNNLIQEYQWIYVYFVTSHFLSGTNVNFQAVVNDDHVILNPNIILMLSSVENDRIGVTGYCSCAGEHVSLACSLVTIIYSNGTNFFEYDQIFWQLKIGCLPFLGFEKGYIQWWYNDTYIENIRNSYSIMLQSQQLPDIRPLNRLAPTQFALSTLDDLLSKIFIEEWIVDETHFDRFYVECAPISCSYTVYEYRSILAAILIIIAICGGLNKGLRIMVLFLGKTIFIIIDKWKNRNNNTITHIPQHFFYRTIRNINLFETVVQDEIIIQKQKRYTKVYLLLFISSLIIILFYTATVGRSLVQTYSLNSLEEYEHLYNLYQDAINCPCMQISIPYDDFVTELRVVAFHQACEEHIIRRILTNSK